jgi:hypothetical protein
MRPKHPAVGSATPAASDVVGVCDELPPLGRLGYLQARSVGGVDLYGADATACPNSDSAKYWGVTQDLRLSIVCGALKPSEANDVL